MGRIYYAPFDNVTITSDATQDLWSLMAAASNRLILHGWEITSSGIAATLLKMTLKRITVVGTGGTAITETKADPDDSAHTASVRVGDTAPGTPGDSFKGFQWEQLGPVGLIYTPEMRIKIPASGGVALVCNTAAAFEMSGWICWEEI